MVDYRSDRSRGNHHAPLDYCWSGSHSWSRLLEQQGHEAGRHHGAADVGRVGHHRGGSSTTAAAASATVWLCKPGATPNPCLSGLATTKVTADGTNRRHAQPSAADRPEDRLLLRVPDGERAEDGDRRPHHRSGRDLGGQRPGAALLAGLPGLRPDVPPAHAQRDRRRRAPATAAGQASASGTSRRPGTTTCPRQPRPWRGAHRALAGRVHAHPADQEGHRRQPGRRASSWCRRCCSAAT